MIVGQSGLVINRYGLPRYGGVWMYIVQYEWIYYSYGLYNGSKYTSYSIILD